MMGITIKDVAREAGVSHMTVSRVINNKVNISESTRVRVLTAIKKLNYKPNSVARSLVIKKTKLLGMIVPDINNPFFSAMIRGTEKLARENDYNIILGDTEGFVENEKSYMDLMVERMVDGVVLAAPRMEDSKLFESNKMVPLVVVDRHFENNGITHVWADNIDGARQAMEYLIDLGHRRIGFITGPQNVQVSLMREEGYRRSLKKYDIPHDPELVFRGDYLFESGYKSFDHFFRLSSPPSAIFSSNDIMALGFLKRAKEKNVSIPRDVSIVGFDNIELSSLISPPLTTVHHPIVEMGSTGVRLLLNRILQNRDEVGEIRLKNELVVRDSVLPAEFRN
jgi:LacI family repressor for deo operon, udp, cdd, tsx, nupC, and nupG